MIHHGDDQELNRRLAALSHAELVTLIISLGEGIDLVTAGLTAGRSKNDRELSDLGERAMTSRCVSALTTASRITSGSVSP